MTAALRIVAACALAAAGYGVLHDEVTVRVCEAYFTRGHGALVATRSPTLLAFAWGVAAGGWVGVPVGVLLAAVSRLGAPPRLAAGQLVRPGAALIVAVALASTASGVATARTAPPDATLPFAAVGERSRCLGVAAAHETAHGVAWGGALVLAGWAWRKRRAADGPAR